VKGNDTIGATMVDDTTTIIIFLNFLNQIITLLQQTKLRKHFISNHPKRENHP
jgi:hypothetical protein